MMWPLLLLTTFLALAMSALLIAFMPNVIAPYLVGAVLASAVWWTYMLMMVTGGMTSLWSGILGEYWTAQELRKFNKHGWRTINHFMLQGRDIDHVLVGAGGIFAIETKFRSDWSSARRELAGIAGTAAWSARQLQLRVNPLERNVRALVVMWGPRVRDSFDRVFEIDGVTFCPGRHLHRYFADRSSELDERYVQETFERLGTYVASRDIGEDEKSGALPRTVGRGLNDILAATAFSLLLTIAITTPAALHPQGAWSVATAAAAVGVSVLIRRARPGLVRIRIATTAAITISAGLGALLSIVMDINAVH